MKMARNLFLMMIIVILAAGCASNSSGSGSAQQTAATTSQATPADTAKSSGDKVTLTVSSWRVEEIEAFKKINAKFNEKFPNIEIKYEPIKATEYDSALNTALQTGTGADLFYVRPFDRGVNLFKAGNLLELNKDKVPNLANISDTQQTIYKDGDKLFAVPYIYVAYGFLYNEALFQKYNVKVPETWDEFFAALDTFKKNKVTPLALGTKDPWVLTEVLSFGNYGSFVDGENWRKQLIAGKAKTTDKGFVDFLGNLQKWKNYMPDNFEGIDYTASQQMFLAEQAAIFPSGSWEIGGFRAQNPNLKMGFFAAPVKAKGDKSWVGLNGGAGLGVNPKSPHVKEALEYINWLSGPDAQVMTGNLMPGLFPSANIDSNQLTDPLAKAWLKAGGAKGENFAIGWGLEKVSIGNPGAYQLASDNLPLLLNGKLTPDQVAKKIQDGLDSWYKP